MPDSHVHPDTRKKPSKAEERLAVLVTMLRIKRSEYFEGTGSYATWDRFIKYAEHGK